MISFAITVKDEEFEFRRILLSLIPHIRRDKGEEIIVLIDNRTTPAIISLAEQFADCFRTVEFRDNFADHKNKLMEMTCNPWIFQIDADEQIPFYLIKALRESAARPDCPDAVWIPRINYITGNKEGLNKIFNERGWDGFPDYQGRFFRNDGKIRWENTAGGAHEILTGYSSAGTLPAAEEFAILHVKSAEKQIAQDNYYRAIL